MEIIILSTVGILKPAQRNNISIVCILFFEFLTQLLNNYHLISGPILRTVCHVVASVLQILIVILKVEISFARDAYIGKIHFEYYSANDLTRVRLDSQFLSWEVMSMHFTLTVYY